MCDTVFYVRPKKIPVFPLTCRKNLGSVGKKTFYFLSNFYLLEIDQKFLLGLNFITSTRKHTNNEV